MVEFLPTTFDFSCCICTQVGNNRLLQFDENNWTFRLLEINDNKIEEVSMKKPKNAKRHGPSLCSSSGSRYAFLSGGMDYDTNDALVSVERYDLWQDRW